MIHPTGYTTVRLDRKPMLKFGRTIELTYTLTRKTCWICNRRIEPDLYYRVVGQDRLVICHTCAPVAHPPTPPDASSMPDLAAFVTENHVIEPV